MTISYVFFGTPDITSPVLDILFESGRPPRAIVCQPDRKQGRGRKIAPPPAKLWAQKHNIELLQPARTAQPEFLSAFAELDVELGLVFAFGQLLPPELLQLPARGFINIHPSLLPRYRGAAPIPWTLINGDDRTGVSIVKMTPQLDDGDIIAQENTAVDPEENAEELGKRLAVLAGPLVLRALQMIESGQESARPQDVEGVVWAPALNKSDGRIDWQQPAQTIHDRIRGLQPWPGAYTFLGGQTLKIHRAQIAEDAGEHRPGTIVVAAGEQLQIAASPGCIRLIELQLEGKQRMDAQSFLRGRRLDAGMVLDK